MKPPLAGDFNVSVRFSVSGSVTTSGSALTNTNGEATFCYTGPTQPGADAIMAYADTDNDSTQDPDEPSGAATKTWMFAMPTDKDQCKDGGWQRLQRADGTLFKNQGDCVAYVNTGK